MMSSLASGASSESGSSDRSGSCDLDSESGTPRSPTSSVDIASPRPVPIANINKASPVPKLGLAVPRINVNLGATPPLPLGNMSARGFASPRPARDLSGIRESPGQMGLPSSRSVDMAVELLSPAFHLPYKQRGPAGLDVLQVQCASKLGVRPDRIQLYALMPVGGSDKLPDGCQRVAIHVQGSDFSLQAIEEILGENQRLASLASGAGASLHSELERLRLEVAHLKQRLTSSEMLRYRGQQALQELKEEFETLHFDLLQHTDNVLSARTPRPTSLEMMMTGQHK